MAAETEKTKKPTKRSKKKIGPVYYLGTGRRKEAISRVRLAAGTGRFIINGKQNLIEYFGRETLVRVARQPLVSMGMEEKFDVFANMTGGGKSGQAGALRLGIARALLEVDETLRAQLKKNGFLTRDPRMTERKKYGLKKARKRPQFSKR